MFGEIGTTQEEDLAELIEEDQITKPVIAYIGGSGAESGTRYSHASAIVERGRGSYESKVKALTKVGAHVVKDFADLPIQTKNILSS